MPTFIVSSRWVRSKSRSPFQFRKVAEKIKGRYRVPKMILTTIWERWKKKKAKVLCRPLLLPSRIHFPTHPWCSTCSPFSRSQFPASFVRVWTASVFARTKKEVVRHRKRLGTSAVGFESCGPSSYSFLRSRFLYFSSRFWTSCKWGRRKKSSHNVQVRRVRRYWFIRGTPSHFDSGRV